MYPEPILPGKQAIEDNIKTLRAGLTHSARWLSM